MLHNVHNSMI